MSIISDLSFLLGRCLLGVLLSLSSWGFVRGFFLFCFLLGLQGSFLLFHDLLILLDGLGVHLDGCVAKSTIIPIPVLSHESSRSAGRASFSLLCDGSLA
jgi:hypothetical protein